MDLKEQYDKLLRYCYAKTKDRYLAEDIVQETFLKFWQSKSYRDTGKEFAYLYTIARNLCMDEFRKPKDSNIDLYEPAGADEISKYLLTKQLNEALESLNEDKREVLILRYANDVKISDISTILGISRFAVNRRIKEALSDLKCIMEGDVKL